MIWLTLFFYLLLRLSPYFSSPVPLGYDPGLYLYLWRHDLSISWLQTVYPPLIFWLGKILSFFIDPANFLIPLSFFIALLLFVSLYLYTHNRWTVLLLATSAIQYRMWWYYYIKNVLCLSFILFYLYFDQKKSKLKYLFPLLIPLLHQPTAIIFFLILIFKKDFKSIIVFILSFLFYYPFTYQNTILPYFQTAVSTIGTASGTFYTLPQSLLLMSPYLPLGLYGFYLSTKNKTYIIIRQLFVVSFLIPLFGLFLSNRFIPFFDIFVIILAGYTLSSFRRFFKTIYSLFLIFFIFIFVIKNSSPLINADEMAEIKLLNTTPANAYILVTDNEYTPWIYGYSGRKPIAPGFGENDVYWTADEWQSFWSDQNRLVLLQKLPQPLYLWIGDKSAVNNYSFSEACFTRFSWHVWKFNCYKKLP